MECVAYCCNKRKRNLKDSNYVRSDIDGNEDEESSKNGNYQELSIGKPSIMDLKICLSTGTVAILNFF